jgi:hypothetical protein
MAHELHRQFRVALELRQLRFADTSPAEFMARDHSLSFMASSSSISPTMLKEDGDRCGHHRAAGISVSMQA